MAACGEGVAELPKYKAWGSLAINPSICSINTLTFQYFSVEKLAGRLLSISGVFVWANTATFKENLGPGGSPGPAVKKEAKAKDFSKS